MAVTAADLGGAICYPNAFIVKCVAVFKAVVGVAARARNGAEVRASYIGVWRSVRADAHLQKKGGDERKGKEFEAVGEMR